MKKEYKKKKKATGRRKEERKKKKKQLDVGKKKFFWSNPTWMIWHFRQPSLSCPLSNFLHILGRKLFGRLNEKTRRPISNFFSPLWSQSEKIENPLAINTCSFGTNEQVLIMGSSANDVGPYSLYILVTLHPYMHPLPLQISSLHTWEREGERDGELIFQTILCISFHITCHQFLHKLKLSCYTYT